QQLVAYVVGEATADALKAQLARSLPEYMVPAQWLFLEALPLSPNGKLDRRQLPSPQAQAQKAYVAPEGELEHAIAAIWQDVLRQEQVGRFDHFFELGGHSLLAVSVVSRLQLELGVAATPQTLFQYPVLAQFAAQMHVEDRQDTGDRFSRLESLLDEMEEV
ncbi:MAG TPA: phosphopantetheine-binding protein, partial [Pseudomonas sp.]|nr:phosphopantetheine-binding protein [Pseudomonas sp.]